MPGILSAVSRFTIRDLLWLTVVAAILCAWRIDREHWRNVAKRWHDEYGKLEASLIDLIRRLP